VRSYIARAFKDRFGAARGAMETLAASLPPEELNRVGFRLYERFRPEVPDGVQGWGAKGELRVEQIVGAAGETLDQRLPEQPLRLRSLDLRSLPDRHQQPRRASTVPQAPSVSGM